MEKRQHIENVIHRKSKDEDYGVAIACFLDMLKELQIEFAVMGSTALQTYLPFFHRLPNDLDITLPEEKIQLIEKYCDTKAELKFELDFVASRVYYKKGYSLHLIPEQMRWVDRSTNTIFDRYQVFHRDRLECRSIKFVMYAVEVAVPVPVIEYSFCLYITQRLDCNIYHDIVLILINYDLSPDVIIEFLGRVPVLISVLKHRLTELLEIASSLNPELIPKIQGLGNTFSNLKG